MENEYLTDLYIICLLSVPTFSASLAINSPHSHDTANPQIPRISTHCRYPKKSAGGVYKSSLSWPNFMKDTDIMEQGEPTVEPCAPKGCDLTGTGLTTPGLLSAADHLL